jgi:hypothetical protein
VPSIASAGLGPTPVAPYLQPDQLHWAGPDSQE